MPKAQPRPTLKKIRCLYCGRHARSTVLGRCPRCLSVANALASDWTVDSALVRQVVRHDSTRLVLYVRQEHNEWGVHAVETVSSENDDQFICRVTRRQLLPDALAAGEAFARRWLENAPGTSVATYVERPTERPSNGLSPR